MWAEAAKWLNKFDEAVLTALGAEGYPVSVRVNPRDYAAATGELSTPLPGELRGVEGPANLLGHYHDEKMWNIKAIEIKGRISERAGTWVFTSTSFNPPAKLAVVSFVRNARTSAQRYLDKRGLQRPEVNWAEIKEAQRRAAAP